MIKKRFSVCCFAFHLILFLSLTCLAEFRMWTGNNGVSLEAELVGISDDGNKVFFKTRQGILKQSDVASLSSADASYVASRRGDLKLDVMSQFRGQWVSLAQAKEILAKERERGYILEAGKLMKEKSKPRATFKVIQVLSDGIICYLKEGSFLVERSSDLCSLSQHYGNEYFVLLDASSKYAADSEWYTGDLHWSGNFTYTTVRNVQSTVNSYCLGQELAIRRVRKLFGLYDKNSSSQVVPPNANDVRDSDAGSDGLKGFGSGFLVSKDGYLITNCHVVRKAKIVRVRTLNGSLNARVLALDPDNDIALLKVEGEFAHVTFAADKTARLGQTVFTLGFPMPELQGFSPKVTKGVISSLSGIQDDVRMYQIDAAVQPGNSGGPLADERGNIVGVVVARLNDAFVAQNTGSLPQNINYAVKKSYVLAFLDNTPDATQQTQPATEQKTVTFEEAVERVQKATVMVVVY